MPKLLPARNRATSCCRGLPSVRPATGPAPITPMRVVRNATPITTGPNARKLRRDSRSQRYAPAANKEERHFAFVNRRRMMGDCAWKPQNEISAPPKPSDVPGSAGPMLHGELLHPYVLGRAARVLRSARRRFPQGISGASFRESE